MLDCASYAFVGPTVTVLKLQLRDHIFTFATGGDSYCARIRDLSGPDHAPDHYRKQLKLNISFKLSFNNFL